jgi:GNAT superfamily N-acetyltransferase
VSSTDIELVDGPLRGAALDQAVNVAVRAFDDDPFFSYLFPKPDQRHRSVGKLHRTVMLHLAKLAVTRAAVRAGEVVGVAMWIPPGRWPYPPLLQLRQGIGAVRAFLPDVSSLGRGGRILRVVEQSHPKTPPHWYLQLLMVDPDAQRQGIGGRLQAPELATCDREGRFAWLETQKPENVPYYARFGFEVVQEHHPVPEGPSMWSMRREPVAGAG